MRTGDSIANFEGRVAALAALARRAGAETLARDAEALAERLREGRFYVACVGQFKRGKSSLINALVGAPILPTGVVPITTAITVVRHGETPAARVRFGEREWEECDPSAMATFVSEEYNPDNEKNVTGVEVFVPSPLLAGGMCLVDTPGLGSVSATNSAATRAFVPHIDAALVVLGADPPISGEELTLVQEIAREVRDLVVVLNKADRLLEAERAEAMRFTERVFQDRVGRSPGAILQVSATERLVRDGPERDWGALVARLQSLARESRADLVRRAEARGMSNLAARVLDELDEQRAALVRPVHESEARVDALRGTVGNTERSLEELAHRMTAVRERLAQTFSEERDRFFAMALPEARGRLKAAIHADLATARPLRGLATDHVIEIARDCLDRWRREQESRVETLYHEGVTRFTELLDGLQRTLGTSSGLTDLVAADLDTRLRSRGGLFYTTMLTVAPASTGQRLLDLVRSPAGRLRAVQRDACRYLERLLEVNSARVKNSFLDRVVESQRGLEADVRARLRALVASAEQALAQARQTRREGTAAVEARLELITCLRTEALSLRPREA